MSIKERFYLALVFLGLLVSCGKPPSESPSQSNTTSTIHAKSNIKKQSKVNPIFTGSKMTFADAVSKTSIILKSSAIKEPGEGWNRAVGVVHRSGSFAVETVLFGVFKMVEIDVYYVTMEGVGERPPQKNEKVIIFLDKNQHNGAFVALKISPASEKNVDVVESLIKSQK